jgi:hypothetical protein
MFKLSGYVAGLWLGATIAAYGAAAAMVFFTTGQVLVPRKKGCQMMSVQEAATQLTAWTNRAGATHHE